MRVADRVERPDGAAELGEELNGEIFGYQNSRPSRVHWVRPELVAEVKYLS